MEASGWALLCAGALIVLLADLDAMVTTVAVGSGRRPLSARLAGILRRLLHRVPRLLPMGGPLVLLATVSTWIGLLWLGWALIFAAHPGAVVDASSGAPVGGVSRAYYAGYTIFTLGNGDLRPDGGVWQIATVLATLNGLAVVTLAITYLVPVTSAVVQRRQQAATLTALGDTAEDVVATAWDGRDLSLLSDVLQHVAQAVLLTAHRHLAYPVLHDFRSADAHAAGERTVALLDEVVTLLRHGVDPSVRPAPGVLVMARAAVSQATAGMPVDVRAGPLPPLPDLGHLAAHGIPVRPTAEFEADASALAERRRHLAGMVAAAGWLWPTRSADG